MKLNYISKLANKSSSFSNFFKMYVEYLRTISNRIEKKDLENFLKEFEKIRLMSSTLYVAGNGGSAANAMTMANDLGFDILKKTKTKKPFKIISLVENTSVITAISNDVGYDEIFTNQLKIHYKKKDVLLVLSASGNSKNLINAANWVKKRKGRVLGLLGFDGGKLKKICDKSIIIKSAKGEYGPVEDFHLIINHTLAHWFQHKLKN